MTESSEQARKRLERRWSQYYAPQLAALIATVTVPFDATATSIAPRSYAAHRAAKSELKTVFIAKKVPTGGEIENQIAGIAKRLIESLRDDAASTQALALLEGRLQSLNGSGPDEKTHYSPDLVVPDEARKFDGQVPFAMWR